MSIKSETFLLTTITAILATIYYSLIDTASASEHFNGVTVECSQRINAIGDCADLKGAKLDEANLVYSKLRKADLRDANLRLADFRSADLTGSDLSGADLSGANLLHVNINRARFKGTKFDAFTIFPQNWGKNEVERIAHAKSLGMVEVPAPYTYYYSKDQKGLDSRSRLQTWQLRVAVKRARTQEYGDIELPVENFQETAESEVSQESAEAPVVLHEAFFQ